MSAFPGQHRAQLRRSTRRALDLHDDQPPGGVLAANRVDELTRTLLSSTAAIQKAVGDWDAATPRERARCLGEDRA